jgi:hypothetical protein
MESFIQLLAVDPKVLGVTRADMSTLEVPHKNLHKVSLVVDEMGRKLFQPGSH